MQAGDLNVRLEFQTRSLGDDGYGNRNTDFETQFTHWAEVRYLRGGESVIASRLNARQPAIIRVRANSLAKLITADWQAVGDGRIFDVKEQPTTAKNSGYLEFLAEARPADA